MAYIRVEKSLFEDQKNLFERTLPAFFRKNYKATALIYSEDGDCIRIIISSEQLPANQIGCEIEQVVRGVVSIRVF